MKFWNRRTRTVTIGAVPVVVLVSLIGLPSVPGTDIDLTVPFAAEGKGPTFNTLGEVQGKPVVEIDGAPTSDSEGQLNMTTVSVRTKLTLAQALGRWLTTDDTLVPLEQVFPSNKSPEEVQKQNAMAFAASESNATMSAMNYLKKPLETAVIEVSKDSPANGVLKVNDIITKVDGKKIDTPDKLAAAVKAKKPGDKVKITVQRVASEKNLKVTLGEVPEELHSGKAGAFKKGQAFLGVTSVAQPAGDLRVRYNLQDVGGPSAGLMFSLAVVDKLTPKDLTSGKFIAGTGTIDSAGKVGPIGGITHKIRAAGDEGAEYFFVPADNCSEALTVKDATPTLVKVDSLEGAVEELKAIESGSELHTCG